MNDRIKEAEQVERSAMLELLSAVLARYAGSDAMTQDEIDGYICRYGTAVRERRELITLMLSMPANNQLLN